MVRAECSAVSDGVVAVFATFLVRFLIVTRFGLECRVPGEGRSRKQEKVTKQLRTNCCEVQKR